MDLKDVSVSESSQFISKSINSLGDDEDDFDPDQEEETPVRRDVEVLEEEQVEALMFRGEEIKFSEAPEPSDIIWENLEIGETEVFW